MASYKLKVNGRQETVEAWDPGEPLLYVVGDAAKSPFAAALANAIFDATGIRLRSVPFTPDKLESAL